MNIPEPSLEQRVTWAIEQVLFEHVLSQKPFDGYLGPISARCARGAIGALIAYEKEHGTNA